MKRYQGVWHIENRMLISNGVFLLTEDQESMKIAICEMLSIPSAEGNGVEVAAVEEAAVEFLRSLCGNGQKISLSRGYIRSGITYVTEGPLKGKESLVRKINRHKRLAKVEIPAAVEMAEVGLEIYAKD